MIYFIRKIIRAFAAPKHRLACSSKVWNAGVAELRRRTGGGLHESGAFLLGTIEGGRRRIERFAYYDDLDPHSLDSGIVTFDGAGYGPLWQMCRDEGLTVVADIHVHPGVARQSPSDRANPMIAKKGHIALIAPDFAAGDCMPGDLGAYEYQGDHNWSFRTGAEAENYYYVGYGG
ncbi:MAG: hypothetical protein AB7J13_09940 [Pyrinomonadaceae bacterium]